MSLTNDPALANQPAEENQIVGVFETYERARDARNRLLEEGIPASDMDLLDRNATATDANFTYERQDEGFWGAIKRFFGADDEAYGYAEGLRRGHSMLVVRAPVGRHDRIVEIMETFDPIDFNAREEEWRKEGWTGAPLTAGAATAGTELGRTGLDRPAVEPTVADSSLAQTNAAARATGTAAATTPLAAGGKTEEVLPVVEEQVRVGKRRVDRGGVRVRSYVVERPVSEDVRLRDERIDVQRRAVDRPASGVPEDAFRERTIEVTATGEEAVVAKDARVVEEVVVRKDDVERTETVTGTERKTQVEVEDERTGAVSKPEKPLGR